MKEDLQAKIIKTIDDEYESILNGLIMLKNAFDKGRFSFLLSKIEIIDRRLDNLQKNIVASAYSDFGLVQILGLFLAPLVANIIIQPVFQLALDKLFRKASANYNIFNGPSLGIKFVDSVGSAEKCFIKPFKLSEKVNLNYLYGTVTDSTVGGFINDSGQNIINFSLSFKSKKSQIENTPSTSKSLAISVMLGGIENDLDKAIRKFQKSYIKIQDKANKPIEKSDEKYWRSYISSVEKFNKKFNKDLLNSFNTEQASKIGYAPLDSLNDADLLEVMIINVHNLIWGLYLGDSIKGKVKITRDHPLMFVSDGNLPKESIDYLIQNTPSPKDSFISREITNFPNKKPDKYRDWKGSQGELFDNLIRYYIDNPQEGKLLDENVFSSPAGNKVEVSLYARAAFRMSEWFINSYDSMNSISNSVTTTLIDLSLSKN